MHTSRFVFFLCILSLLAVDVLGRGIWGAKRKKGSDEEDAEEVEVDIGGKPANFEASRRKFETAKSSSRQSTFNKDQIVLAINTYIDVLEKMMSAPEFETVVTPESIRSIMSQIPALGGNPEIAALMDGEQFSDPATLKQTIIEGVRSMREYSEQLADILSDPAQIAALLQQLPEEVRVPLEGLMSGDMSSLKAMIGKIPGLDPSQRKLLKSLLDGNAGQGMGAIQESVSEILGDASQVEKARQQMLENPQMAEMLGMSLDVLEDKEKFAELIAQGLDALGATGGDLDEPAIGEVGRRKFAASMAE